MRNPVPALLLAALAALVPARVRAQSVPSGHAKILFEAANRERTERGLQPLHWDASLAAAALAHARHMAAQRTLSHQFAGEPDLQTRARHAGARFNIIAENVAEGPDAGAIQTGWMNSPSHRANLLDASLDAAGIAVAESGGDLFATEDLSLAVEAMNLDEQESRVSTLLSAEGMPVAATHGAARETCVLQKGYAGPRPSAVVRFETGDLSKLPGDVARRASSRKYRSAAVGACNAPEKGGFTRFRIAILFY